MGAELPRVPAGAAGELGGREVRTRPKEHHDISGGETEGSDRLEN